MIRFYKTPWIVKKLYPTPVWERTSENDIYLTFDDGPQPEVTEWVLEELQTYNARATFFSVGENLKKYPELATSVLKRGHKIANHTHTHLKGWCTEDEAYCVDVEKCERIIKDYTRSSQKPLLFRPPHGRIKGSQIQKLSAKYEIIMWSHLSWDFAPGLDVKKALRSLKKAKPGSILVFHDSIKAFKNLNVLLPEVLAHFKEKNLNFNTL